MTKYKKIAVYLIGVVAISSSLYGDMVNEKDPLSEYQERFSDSLGAKGIDVTKGTNVKDGRGQGTIDDTYMDTVIYNDMFERSSHRGRAILIQPPVTSFMENGIKLSTPQKDHFAYMSKKYNERMAEKAKLDKIKEMKKKEKPKYFVGGYCEAVNRTEIIKASSFNAFDCILDFGKGKFREVQVFAGIYPNYDKEILIGLPLYVTLPDGVRASMKGVVMNIDKTTLNIANEVESYKIRRWIAKYGLAMNNIAYKYAMMYLNDLRASRYNEQITFIDSQNPTGTTGTIPVRTTQITAPTTEEMLAMAGVELIGQLFALGAENILENTEPLFTLYKGQRVWVEGVIDTDKTTMYGTFKEINQDTKKNINQDNSSFQNAGQQIIKAGGGAVPSVQMPSTQGSVNVQYTGGGAL